MVNEYKLLKLNYEGSFFDNFRKDLDAAIEESIRYAMGDKDVVARVETRRAVERERKEKFKALIRDQRSKAVCPFCKNNEDFSVIAESQCHGHGDYIAVTKVTCGRCRATMTELGSGLEGELRGFLKWNNPTLTNQELGDEYSRILQENGIEEDY